MEGGALLTTSSAYDAMDCLRSLDNENRVGLMMDAESGTDSMFGCNLSVAEVHDCPNMAILAKSMLDHVTDSIGEETIETMDVECGAITCESIGNGTSESEGDGARMGDVVMGDSAMSTNSGDMMSVGDSVVKDTMA